jgi:ubiquinone/menaquinone biosynthesis C-methylase UbiE
MFPFEALLPHLPERGRIVDVGCGHGVLTMLAARERPEAQVVGCDVDEGRIALARRLASEAGLPNVRFEVAGAEEASLDGAQAIACVDVMYLLSESAQEKLVARAARALVPGGRLLVKEMAARPRWKAAWNLAQETIAVKVAGWTMGERFFFRDEEGFAALMRAHGLAPRIERLDAGYPHPHLLVRGDK